MLKTMLPVEVLEDAIHLACRAPSYRNSQPWNWMINHSQLQLFIAPERVPSVDHAGRQSLISCGAALDHLRVAMAASRYDCQVKYFPSANSLAYLASIDIAPADCVTELQRRRARAIIDRRSARLPFDQPPNWSQFEPRMHSDVDCRFAYLDVIAEGDRADITEATLLATQLQPFESDMNHWGTTASEHDRHERTVVADDHSVLLVLSAVENTRRAIFGCGETLSQVLIEATIAGFATSIMTRAVEVAATRDIVADVVGRALPQVIVRIGAHCNRDLLPPPAPRRPLSDVLHFAE
jgi:hypothetical protein